MPGRAKGNLPAELTSFVGRRAELTAARRLLSKTRMVTFIGSGGVGKTRMALRAAAEARRAFPDGVWLVTLAQLNEGQLVADAVASVFGLMGHSADPTGRLGDHLSDKQLLLVLDNCEHLVDACSILAAKLLAAAPRLRIIATSRHMLGVDGEHVLPVPPLGIPREDVAVHESELLASDAVALFVDRVSAVVPEFKLTAENLPTVHRICRRLDGIPLALELAAVRCRALGLEELLERLDDVYSLLIAGPRGGEPRQRTLEAAIAWSHSLCSPAERLMWARLSVFADGFGIEAAEEVCSGDGIDRDEVFDLVAGLVDKSVVARIKGSYGWQARFQLLETLRQFGARQLTESGMHTTVRTRHLKHFRSLVNRAETEYFGPGEVAWLKCLRREHANLRAAFEFCLGDPARIDIALDMGARLEIYWLASGSFREGLLWLRRGLDAQTEPRSGTPAAMVVCAYLSEVLGDPSTADTMLNGTRALAERAGDQRMLAYVDWCRGLGELFRGDIHVSLGALDRAITAFRELSDDAGLYQSLNARAIAAFVDLPAEGLAHINEALARAESAGAGWSRSNFLLVLSLYRLRDGAVAEAADLSLQSLAVFHDTNDQRGLGRTIRALGWCAAAEKQHERAAVLLGGAEMLRGLAGTAPSHEPVRAVFEHYENETREALGKRTYESRFKHGGAMTTDEMVEYALTNAVEPAEHDGRSGIDATRLTRRETEIAKLVAEGLTNKEIAAQLVISQRTADSHIEHILAKLGFRSRTQIATWIGAADAQG